MAIDLAAAKQHLPVVGDDDDAVIERQIAVAEDLVERYAPSAPDTVKDEAQLRVMGWLYSSRGLDADSGLDRPNAGRANRSPLRASGAAAALLPWRARRGGTC